MRNPQNIQALLDVGLEYMGFIFYEPSKRNVEDDVLNGIAEVLENQLDVKRVGVFVNASLAEISRKKEQFGLDVVQLHGQEHPEFCQQVKDLDVEVIKAFSVDGQFDFGSTLPYDSVCDYFLFDTKGKLPGGNGALFDWSILEHYEGGLPFFLSGGISPDSVASIQSFHHSKLYALDINSGFELKPAEKNIDAIRQFKNELSNRFVSMNH